MILGKPNLWDALHTEYSWVIAALLRDAQNERIPFHGTPSILITLFRWSGDQRECFWEVRDTGKLMTNDINFHGENTSQWVSAGAIIFTISMYDEWAKNGKRSPFSIHT